RMDPARQAARHDPDTVAGRLWSGIRYLVERRSALPHLHAAVQSEVLPVADPGILAVLRVHPEGELLELFNVTEQHRSWPAEQLVSCGFTNPYDALGNRPVAPSADGHIPLPPYATMWIIDRQSGGLAGAS
ncbi:MAG TPA: hypothetical protein VHT50_14845, partial [Mycobacterium sp.]|nr:hypothetical protein [Mycobacterium sp.]